MQIYINDQRITELEEKNNIEEVLEAVNSRLEEEIVEQIYLDEVEVNQEFLLNNEIDFDRSSTLEFKSKQVESLIQETLQEAEGYLPKLKQGVEDAADLFRWEDEEANSKYQLCLEGLDWYTEVLERILSLLEAGELQQEGKEILSELNDLLLEVMEAFQDQDLVLVADLLEYEVVDYVEKLISFNNRLQKEYKNS